ncbi:MAG: DUF929 family protein [bacterium]
MDEQQSQIDLENLKYRHKRNELLIIAGIIFVSIALIFLLFDRQPVGTVTYVQRNTTAPSTTAPQVSTPSISLTPLPSNLLQEINNFPSSDLISFAKELLNGSINIPIDSNTQYGLFPVKTHGVTLNSSLITNGKVDFYFAGQSACQFCARDKWAIALALSQFGKFSSLSTGYTYGDGNYPTLFFSNSIENLTNLPNPYQKYDIGNSYSSPYIHFVSVSLYPYSGSGFYGPAVNYMEEAYPNITGLFNITLRYDPQVVAQGTFGTPLTAFGNYLLNGAMTDVPIPYENFSSIISGFYSDNSEFAEATLAGADMYIADFCHFNNTLNATICKNYNWTDFYNKYG